MSPPRALVSLIAVAAVTAPAGVGAVAGTPTAPPTPSGGAPATLAPSLGARLARAPGPLPVLVTLREQVHTGRDAGGAGNLIRSLRSMAARSQPALLARLPRPARRMWLVNAVALRARPAEIRRLARDPAVARVEYDRRVRLFAPTGVADADPPPGLFERGGWGSAAIGAPAVWRDYGIDGRGVRVGSIDSGVDADHPDLAGKIAAWRDFVNGRQAPYDDHGHGTHTIGTMVGGAAGGAPVGVAPGARVVVAKALDGDGAATLSTLLAAGQWITDPDGNPLTHDAPSVVNASWGAPAGPGGQALRRLIARWRELGIVPVFSAGNTGPGGSVAAPAVFPETLAVGALGPRGRVAAFSSRGAAGEPTLKPDLAAPGHQIVSSVPGGGWGNSSGTSMAAPHVAGAIALLRQADPTLSVEAIETTLRESAHDVAQAGPDRRSGAGALDARAAVAAVLGARAARPEVSLVALPPAVTNRAVLTFAVGGADAPLGVWLDGLRVPHRRSGALVRVPVRAPGRHTVAIAALDPRSGAPGRARRFWVTIDRQAPRLRLVVARTGLLDIHYRARADDGVAGVAEQSLRSLLSDAGDSRGGPAGRHTFTGPGPYWIEAQVADRAGNVRRVRRALSWPPAPLARRLARNEALRALQGPFGIARLQRRANGRYGTASRLARLLAANWEFASFVAIPAPSAPLPRGAVGVWSDGSGRVVLSTERAGRRYAMEDRDGRVSRGVLSLPRT
jgi:subtilisin family serine protease